MNGMDYVESIKSLDESNTGIPSLLIHSAGKLLPRLVAVWPSVARRLSNPGLRESIPPQLPPTEHTRYLWACVEPDPVPIWAESAGLPNAPHIRRAIQLLMDSHAVFPDGTSSVWVGRVLQTEAERFGIKVPLGPE